MNFRLALLLAAFAGCYSGPEHSGAAPTDGLSDAERRRVEESVPDVASTVPVCTSMVAAPAALVEFLLSEPLFTASVLREMRWDDAVVTLAELDGRRVYTIADPGHPTLILEQVSKQPGQWRYLAQGALHGGALSGAKSSALLEIKTEPQAERTKVDATAHVSVRTESAAAWARVKRGLVDVQVREGLGYFALAAGRLAERAARDPGWLHAQLVDARRVDQAVLEEFRKRFVPK